MFYVAKQQGNKWNSCSWTATGAKPIVNIPFLSGPIEHCSKMYISIFCCFWSSWNYLKYAWKCFGLFSRSFFQLCPLELDSPEPSPKSHWIPIVDRWSGNSHRSRRAYGGESQPNPTINPLQQEMHCTTGSVLYNISRMLQWEMPFRALR